MVSVQNYSSTTSMAIPKKLRDFKVVPVDAAFSRGRWKCCDYGEMPSSGSDTPTNGPRGNMISIGNLTANLPATAAIGMVNPLHVITNVTADLTKNLSDCSLFEIASSMQKSPMMDGIIDNDLPTGTGPNVVAIDNKIEQAMDLVKTHLMYAVREEVEILRAKIIDLEKKVLRLEKENALLRENAPAEILSQLHVLLAGTQPLTPTQTQPGLGQRLSENIPNTQNKT